MFTEVRTIFLNGTAVVMNFECLYCGCDETAVALICNEIKKKSSNDHYAQPISIFLDSIEN